MRKKLVAGNWKMHGGFRANDALLDALLPTTGDLGCEVLVCVPYPYLGQVAARLAGSGMALGAQDVCRYAGPGAFTGEVSAGMLAEFGCRYVIVGHSERRSLFGETDAVVAEKCAVALAAGLSPILCVGETLSEREAGRSVAVVVEQMEAVLDRLGIAAIARLVVAYEPVWAIGTGLTASPAQAQEVHAAIRARVAELDRGVADGLRILYGGSVKPQSAPELFAQPDIDGGLIGGAALVAGDFLAICRAAA